MTEKKDYEALLAEAQNALAEGTDQAITDQIELREAVCAYLTAQLARGKTVESVLSTIEDLLLEAMNRVASREGIADGHHELAQQIIDWCIQLDRTGRIRLVE